MSGMSGGMSGEGSGPSFSTNNAISCDALKINTLVASPKEEVLHLIKEGDLLIVTAESQSGPINVYYHDDCLGSIMSSEEIQLLRCMNEGTKYNAKVLKIEGAICRIMIYAVK